LSVAEFARKPLCDEGIPYKFSLAIADIPTFANYNTKLPETLC